MNKPVFGKWTRVEDALPESDQFVLFIFSDKRMDIGMGDFFSEDEGIRWNESDFCDDFTHWMPLPKAGEDAFTELRALLSRIDKDYEENLEYSHYEEGQQDLIKEIREVIE